MEDLLKVAEAEQVKVWPGQEVQKERFGPEATVEDIVRGGGPAASPLGYRSPLELLEPHLR
jgi:hypothetical protein